ncbi:MAG: YgiQ family radical SAM protein [Elusimicrobia bacterium]|nr:YgiQ family radical SAM protein [Elusimicrobiota bacterium]
MAKSHAFLPLTQAECAARGWDYVDVVIVTGDAYVDHPSFAMAMIGRVLEAAGWRVAILSRPDWRSCAPWRAFGKPRLFFAISPGNVDSMINLYTANKKPRSEDDYAEGGQRGGRPERAAVVYAQRAREAYPGVNVVIGGVEASMRRLAHYDYWSDTVKRSILLDSKADLLAYGMGEKTVTELARRMNEGTPAREIRGLRGTVYAASEADKADGSICRLPSYEGIKSDKAAFLKAELLIHENTDPRSAKTLVQQHAERLVVQNPPTEPATPEELAGWYALPFTRLPHPSYKKTVPAWEMIKDSITIHRGCGGGCSFCSLALHQGRLIQSRPEGSVLQEAREVAKRSGGIISDLGGPSANMYGASCARPGGDCARHSCLWPEICPFFKHDQPRLAALMRRVRQEPGVKKALINSGVRMDLALACPDYISELAAHHTGGQLSVAPEHTDPAILKLMHKPSPEKFASFSRQFLAASAKAGKQQFLIPYFISAFPGADLKTAAAMALELKRQGIRPRQINDFIPAPMEIATAAYYTGIDPHTGAKIHVPKGENERKLHRALLQYFKPENRLAALRALRMAGMASAAKELFGGTGARMHGPRR